MTNVINLSFYEYHAVRLVIYFNLARDNSKKVTEKIKRANNMLREVRDMSTFPLSV